MRMKASFLAVLSFFPLLFNALAWMCAPRALILGEDCAPFSLLNGHSCVARERRSPSMKVRAEPVSYFIIAIQM